MKGADLSKYDIEEVLILYLLLISLGRNLVTSKEVILRIIMEKEMLIRGSVIVLLCSRRT